MRIGAHDYPEAWPPQQWPRDMANSKKLGMEFVHMAEFSWAFLEPRKAGSTWTGWNRRSSSRLSKV